MMPDQWDDDYLDALDAALVRRRQERINEAGKEAMDARLAAFDAQQAANEAERKYLKLGGTGL
jgi:hypothetical protein